jgi:hypothetical protein
MNEEPIDLRTIAVKSNPPIRFKFNIPFLVLLVITLLLLFKDCGSNSEKPNQSDKDSLIQANTDLQADISILKDLTANSDSVRIEYKYRYRTLHDTIPCEIKLVYCDSVIYHDSIAINYRDSIIYKFDTLTANYQKVAKIDSLTIDSLIHSRKKFWKGFKLGLGIGFGAGFVGGAVIK